MIDRQGEKRIESPREVSLFSFSLCFYRNSSAVPPFLSLRTMCSVEEFGRSLCTLVSTATGAWSLNNASWTGPELEATVPGASCCHCVINVI